MRVAILNVSTLTGKGMEVAEMMVRRTLDVLSLQKIRWTGQRARDLGFDCKLYYTGGEEKRNGVGNVLHGDIKKTLVEVIRVNNRLMAVRVQLRNVMLFVVAAYAPQSEREDEVKQQFRDELQTLTDKASDGELLVVLGDMNAHIGSDREGLEECIGRYGRDNRNAEGQNLLEMCSPNGWMIASTWFEKRDNQLYTYYSGRSKMQIDMIIVRKAQWRYMVDTKVIPSETVVPQHKQVVATLRLERFGRKDLCSTETRVGNRKRNGAVIERFPREVL